jgi:hypothetical protein
MIRSPIRVTIKRLPAIFFLAVLLQGGTASSANIEVLYAPNDAPLDRLVALYQQARRYIYVSVYGLTSPRAVEALVAAKKRGMLKVREHFIAMWSDHARFREWK